VCLPSRILPNGLTQALQSLAPGQVLPAGKESVSVDLLSLALPTPIDSRLEVMMLCDVGVL
jgi:hypothetical protein